MALKKHLVRCCLLLLGFLAGVLAIALYPFELSPPGVRIEVFDWQYACGECYVRFGVTRFLGEGDKNQKKNDPPGPKNKFEGWDILVVHQGTVYLDAHSFYSADNNANCSLPYFHLTGQFKRKLIYALLYDGDRYDGIYFDAVSGTVINRNPACKRPKEVPLWR